MYHEYIDNKIELSSLSETNTQQGHQNGYQDYPYSVLQLMYEHDSRENTKRQEPSDIR